MSSPAPTPRPAWWRGPAAALVAVLQVAAGLGRGALFMLLVRHGLRHFWPETFVGRFGDLFLAALILPFFATWILHLLWLPSREHPAVEWCAGFDGAADVLVDDGSPIPVRSTPGVGRVRVVLGAAFADELATGAGYRTPIARLRAFIVAHEVDHWRDPWEVIIRVAALVGEGFDAIVRYYDDATEARHGERLRLIRETDSGLEEIDAGGGPLGPLGLMLHAVRPLGWMLRDIIESVALLLIAVVRPSRVGERFVERALREREFTHDAAGAVEAWSGVDDLPTRDLAEDLARLLSAHDPASADSPSTHPATLSRVNAVLLALGRRGDDLEALPLAPAREDTGVATQAAPDVASRINGVLVGGDTCASDALPARCDRCTSRRDGETYRWRFIDELLCARHARWRVLEEQLSIGLSMGSQTFVGTALLLVYTLVDGRASSPWSFGVSFVGLLPKLLVVGLGALAASAAVFALVFLFLRRWLRVRRSAEESLARTIAVFVFGAVTALGLGHHAGEASARRDEQRHAREVREFDARVAHYDAACARARTLTPGARRPPAPVLSAFDRPWSIRGHPRDSRAVSAPQDRDAGLDRPGDVTRPTPPIGMWARWRLMALSVPSVPDSGVRGPRSPSITRAQGTPRDGGTLVAFDLRSDPRSVLAPLTPPPEPEECLNAANVRSTRDMRVITPAPRPGQARDAVVAVAFVIAALLSLVMLRTTLAWVRVWRAQRRALEG